MHRNRKQVTLAAAIVLSLASALMIATAGAAGATPPDLSSHDAINAYLTSIGVNSAQAVWQETHKNYAGPNCPGASWSCVPATTPIVQITDAGGTNLFACGELDCVVVQVALNGGQNGGACVRGDNKGNNQTQVCEITQANDGDQNSTNAAAISQNIQQNGNSTQDARQVARITQANISGKNIGRINQVIGQRQDAKGGAAATHTQEAHQAGTILQDNNSGDNTSNVTQRQDQFQRASKATTSITQNQNTVTGGDPLCDRPVDDPAFNQDKNQCAEVTQNPTLMLEATGSNDSNLSQLINESQMASAAPLATQSQGTFLGGQSGDVDQLSSGVSTSSADEDMLQNQSASGIPVLGLSQFQDTGDPRCCQTQANNQNNTADIDQSTNQNASSPDAVQLYTLTGECVSTGACNVQQSATVDGGAPDTDSCTESPCLITTTNADID